MTPLQNRRTEPRLRHRLPLRLKHALEEATTYSENISASGVYCTVKHFIPLMTKVQVQLQIPGKTKKAKPTPLTCQGVVVRVEPPLARPGRSTYNIAIFFNELQERDRDRLAAYVQQHLPISN